MTSIGRKLRSVGAFLPPVMESRAALLARFPENPLEATIKAAMAAPDNADALQAFYRALYDADVVVPVDAKGPDQEVPTSAQGEASIGFLSQRLDGIEHAVLFSSLSQMHLAFPEGCRYTRVRMSRLVQAWPDVPAMLNPDGFGRVLPPAEVRGLPLGPIAGREPLPEAGLRQAEGHLDQIIALMFQENADQVLFSPLGIHVFRGSEMVLVGELGVPLTTMLECLRQRAEIGPGRADGLVAAVGTGRPVELLRVDLVTGEGNAEGALIRRSAGTNGWPAAMLPRKFRLAA